MSTAGDVIVARRVLRVDNACVQVLFRWQNCRFLPIYESPISANLKAGSTKCPFMGNVRIQDGGGDGTPRLGRYATCNQLSSRAFVNQVKSATPAQLFFTSFANHTSL